MTTTLAYPCRYCTGLLIAMAKPLMNGFSYQCIGCGALFQSERVEYVGVKPGVIER